MAEPGVRCGKLVRCVSVAVPRIEHLVRQVEAQSLCRVPPPARPCCFNCYAGQTPKADYTGGLSRFGASPPYGVVNSYRECFSGFSFFVEATQLPKFRVWWSSEVYEHWDVSSCGSGPPARVGPGSLLSGMSGVTAQDARYASTKRNERAQSTNGLFKSPGASTGARRSKVQN